MKDSILLTILSGVTVFVFGQFILKLVLDPIVSFKESLGGLAVFCLKYRAKLTNITATLEMQSELRNIISTIISKHQAIPCYDIFSKALQLPSEKDIFESCRLLNLVAYGIVKETSQNQGSLNDSVNIIMTLNKVSKLLKIKLDYSEL